MSERRIAGQLLLLLHRMTGESTLAARLILGWAEENRALLWPSLQAAASGPGHEPAPLGWADLPRLGEGLGADDPDAPEIAVAGEAAALLQFGPFDTELLRIVAAIRQFPSIAGLRGMLGHSGLDVTSVVGALAGAPLGQAARRVRQSAAMELGLIEIDGGCLQTNWRFDRVLDRGTSGEDGLIEALIGPRQTASLAPDDFSHIQQELDFLLRLFGAALGDGMPGVNLLIHGPPGTGKTELARTMSEALGARLFAAGEADEDGDEPNRYVRLHALKRGHRLLARRPGSMLLFDEMEDLVRLPARRHGQEGGSKIFVNRLLEANPVPTIWTSNSIADVDAAHLRRMSYVLKMDHPPARSRARIVARIAGDEGHGDAAGLIRLGDDHPEVSGIARVALKAAAAAGSRPGDAERAARSLLVALRGGRPLPASSGGACLDLGLFESDPPVGALVEVVGRGDAPHDFSILLAGPPGTGKSALARHVAARLDRPLLTRRTSDLLSKWVGGTEANIAAAFAEARNGGAVLFFDEADGLFFDRAGARTSWEVTQVNELLTWMDHHDLPFIAATNFVDRLDPAAMRRFVFKLTLHALSPARAAQAFASFFGRQPPSSLLRVNGLTPGDFAVVARQLRFRPAANDEQIVQLLAQEVGARASGPGPIGF